MFEVKQLTNPSTILESIKKDIDGRAKYGLKKAADLVPGMLEQNFEVAGERGGNLVWQPISLFSLMTLRQVNKSQGARWEPLIDSGHLKSSGEVFEYDEHEYHVWLDEVGFEHDEGIAITPYGAQVPQRVHMFIVEGEDTNALDQAFEKAFEK